MKSIMIAQEDRTIGSTCLTVSQHKVQDVQPCSTFDLLSVKVVGPSCRTWINPREEVPSKYL